MAKTQHIMFDIDGTLVESFEFDESCFLQAVQDVLNEPLDSNWDQYPDITDTGILRHFLNQSDRLHLLEDTVKNVKKSFVSLIEQHIDAAGVKPVNGSLDFFSFIKDHPTFSISFATGGWRETALLKLASANFNTGDIPLASSDDHYKRMDIMKHSLAASNISDLSTVTYFGDGEWDKTACTTLGINFVAVGKRVEHHQQIDDFSNIDDTMKFLSKSFT